MNLNLSNRDKKLLLLLAVIAIASLPYLFLISPMMEKCEALRSELDAMQSKKSTLQQMVMSQDTYLKDTEQLAVETADLMGKFPAGLPQEASILFIDNTERLIPISLYQVNFGEDVAAQMTSEADEQQIDAVEEAMGYDTQDEIIEEVKQTQKLGDGLTAIMTETQFTYDAGYEEWKRFLNYILTYRERMVITNLTAAYTSELNMLSGNFTLVQYAIKGENRPQTASFLEPEMIQGSSNIFMKATGNFSGGSGTGRESDFFLMLNQPGTDENTVILGQTSDIAETTYLTSERNSKQEVTITFTGEAGSYRAAYSIGEKNNEAGGIDFLADNGIVFEIFSSSRTGEDDKVEAILNIINKTDVIASVKVLNEDKEKPRVTIKGKTGDIFIN